MKCAEIQELLYAYADDQLEGSDGARVRTHVEQCATCANELQTVTEMNRVLDSQELVEAPPGFSERVLSAIELVESLPTSPRPGLPFLLKGVILAMAAGAIAVAALWLLSGSSSLPVSGVREQATSLSQALALGVSDATCTVVQKIWIFTAIVLAYVFAELLLSLHVRAALAKQETRGRA